MSLKMSLTRHLEDVFSISSTDDRLQFLNICNQYNLFSSNDVATIQIFLDKSKELLQATETKKDGLAILFYLIDNCSAEVFNQEGPNWIKILGTIIQSNEPVTNKDFSIYLLSKAIPKFAAFPQHSRELSTPYLTPIINELTKPVASMKSLLANATFCLIQLMTYYPKSCIHHKECIREFLLNQISEYPHSQINPSYVKHAFSLLPTLDSVNPSEAWFKLFSSTSFTLKKMLIEVFKNEHCNLEFEEQFTDPLDLELQENNSYDAMTKLAQQSVLVVGCLSQLLKVKNIQLSINSHDVFNMIYTMLMNTKLLLVSIMTEKMETQLGHMLLSLLESFLDLLHQLLLSSSSLIFNQLDEFLKELTDILGCTTHPGKNTIRKPFCLLRVKLYSVIDLCLLSSRGFRTLDNSLFENIVSDIEAKVAPSTKLRDQTERATSTKNQRKVLEKELKPTTSSIKVFSPQMEELHLVCQSALKVLKTLATLGAVKNGGLAQKTFLVLMKQNYYNHQATGLPSTNLYKNDDCRQLLYECFQALAAYLPSLNLCRLSQQMFRQGCSDSNLKIRQLCGDALMRNSKAPGKIVFRTEVIQAPPPPMQAYVNNPTFKAFDKGAQVYTNNRNNCIDIDEDDDDEEDEDEEILPYARVIRQGENEDEEMEDEEELDERGVVGFKYATARQGHHPGQYTGATKRGYEEVEDEEEEDLEEYAQHTPYSSSTKGHNKRRHIEQYDEEDEDIYEEDEEFSEEEDHVKGVATVPGVEDDDDEDEEVDDEEFYEEEVVDIKEDDEQIISDEPEVPTVVISSSPSVVDHPPSSSEPEYITEAPPPPPSPLPIKRVVEIDSERVAEEEDQREISRGLEVLMKDLKSQDPNKNSSQAATNSEQTVEPLQSEEEEEEEEEEELEDGDPDSEACLIISEGDEQLSFETDTSLLTTTKETNVDDILEEENVVECPKENLTHKVIIDKLVPSANNATTNNVDTVKYETITEEEEDTGIVIHKIDGKELVESSKLSEEKPHKPPQEEHDAAVGNLLKLPEMNGSNGNNDDNDVVEEESPTPLELSSEDS